MQAVSSGVRHLSLAGHRVCVETTGAGPPMLLLHGNPDSRHLWAPVQEALGEGFQVICPDMPGFGDSPAPSADFDYRPAHTVPLWDALLDELGIDEPVIVGVHDFGGPWLLPWVARNPDRVRRLVICSAPYAPHYRWHFWARVWQTRGLGELAAWASPRWLFRWEMRRGSKALPVAFCDDAHARATPEMRRCVLRTYRSFDGPEASFGEELPRLVAAARQIPTAVVWGSWDPYIPGSVAEAFGVPVTWAEAGHWTPVECAPVVADLLRGATGPG